MTRDTKALTEGAVLSALTVILATISLYLPPVQVAIPLPLLILTYRHGMQFAIPVAFVSALLAGLASHFVQGFFLVLAMGALGLTLGEGMRQGFKPVLTLIFGTIVMLIVMAATFYLTFIITGLNSLSQMMIAFEEGMKRAMDLYGQVGVDTSAFPPIEVVMQFIKIILPAAAAVSAAVMTFASYWLGQVILGKLGSAVPRFSPFGKWIFPEWMGLTTVAVLIASLMLKLPSPLDVVVINLAYLGAFLLIIEGASLAWHFLDKLTISKGFKIVLLILLYYVANFYLIFAGIMDNFMDFRKLRREPNESHIKG